MSWRAVERLKINHSSQCHEARGIRLSEFYVMLLGSMNCVDVSLIKRDTGLSVM